MPFSFADVIATTDYNITALTEGGGSVSTPDYNINILQGSGAISTSDYDIIVGLIYNNPLFSSVSPGQGGGGGGVTTGEGISSNQDFKFKIFPESFSYFAKRGDKLSCYLDACAITIENYNVDGYDVKAYFSTNGGDPSSSWGRFVVGNETFLSYIYNVPAVTQTQTLGSIPGKATTKMIVQVPNSAPLGKYSFNVTYEAGGVKKNSIYYVEVVDTLPSLLSVVPQDIITDAITGKIILDKSIPFLGLKEIPKIVVIIIIIFLVWYFLIRKR